MKATIKSIIQRITPQKLINIFNEPLVRDFNKGQLSFAQEGEDVILDRFFEKKRNGFYVDVGAHHPWRFSNTYLFYKKGWRGINIDPRPGIMDCFNKERPNDINIDAAIGETEKESIFFIFNEPALSTFCEKRAMQIEDMRGQYNIVDKKIVRQRSLANVLNEFMPPNVEIDFLSIDVEGLDLEVVRSNNWEKYSPTIVIVEQLESSIESIIGAELYVVLNELGYELFAKCINSIIFKKR